MGLGRSSGATQQDIIDEIPMRLLDWAYLSFGIVDELLLLVENGMGGFSFMICCVVETIILLSLFVCCLLLCCSYLGQ